MRLIWSLSTNNRESTTLNVKKNVIIDVKAPLNLICWHFNAHLWSIWKVLKTQRPSGWFCLPCATVNSGWPRSRRSAARYRPAEASSRTTAAAAAPWTPSRIKTTPNSPGSTGFGLTESPPLSVKGRDGSLRDCACDNVGETNQKLPVKCDVDVLAERSSSTLVRTLEWKWVTPHLSL